MPGMSMGTGGGAPLVVLVELALFWTSTVVHLLRLLVPAGRDDGDRPADAGHVAMGVGMTVMVFPGVSDGILRPLAVVYVALAVAFLVRAARVRGVVRRQGQDAALGGALLVMAYMSLAPSRTPVWLTVWLVAMLGACALVHGRRLIHAPGGHGDRLGAGRVLSTAPHVGALVMTLVMAVMIAA